MLVLVSGATATLRAMRDRSNIGGLLQPRAGNRPEVYAEMGIPYAMDNDCFQGLDAVKYMAMLVRCQSVPGCLWCVVPDVVGNARATLALWRLWAPLVASYGFPLAFVAQDGIRASWVPWTRLSCLFIGGTDDYKQSQAAYQLAVEAKRRGKWLHIGRVNSYHRYERWSEIADSIDGTRNSMFPDTYIHVSQAQAKVKQHQLGVL